MDMPRQSASPNESSKERFLRLAQYRTQKVLSAIRVLSHCANSYNYEYTPEQVEKIFSTIQEELALSKSKFTPNQPKTPFTL